ncbi:retrograde regulation protein 2 [Hypoxylon texense]
MQRGRIIEKRASASPQNSVPKLAGPAMVKMLVGPDGREFMIPRKLLVSSCQYFRQRLDSARVDFDKRGQAQLVLTLEDQCPDMFELFAYWIGERRNFDKYIDRAEARRTCKALHWDLVNLHLFAAQVDVPALQDCAMDAIQDVYLRCNWDISPRLVGYVYTACDPQESCRLRKWIVAMTAWTLGGVAAPDHMAAGIQRLFELCPDFFAEYHSHTRKMARTGLEGHFKNPQLRLPSNNLRNEERQFGFRQCSFHTHRSTVGQGKCPHAVSLSPLVSSPYTDGYVESDSDRGGSGFGSGLGSRLVSPTSDTIPESDLETS